MILVIISLTFLIILTKVYLNHVYTYWEKKKVPVPKFKYFFGHLLDAISLKRNIGQIYADAYNKFEGYNYVGVYKCLRPALVLRNPNLIKIVLATDFESFYDNDLEVEEKNDVISGKNPFFLKVPKWKTVRNQITPSFSASKIKLMIPLVQETCDTLVQYLDSEPASIHQGHDTKELCSKYTSDNVASCAFGIKGLSFFDPKEGFRQVGIKIARPNFWNGIKHLALFNLPSVAKYLNVRLFDAEVTAYLRKIMKETIEFRLTNNLVRNDFIDLMLALRDKINDHNIFNDEDILAHAGGFLLDGLETSSTVISFMIYHLAANKHVQENLREEVDEVLEKYNGKITNEAINEMSYLDCVVKESLRLHPGLLLLQKVCTKPFYLPPAKETDTTPEVLIEKGSSIIIPVHALHMDPKMFPEPNEFNPERFSESNKESIEKYAYLPFGEGPRMCLGMRFGLIQSKMMLITLIKNYEMKVNSRTIEPLQIDPKSFLTSAVGGMWVNFYKRKD